MYAEGKYRFFLITNKVLNIFLSLILFRKKQYFPRRPQTTDVRAEVWKTHFFRKRNLLSLKINFITN